MTAEKGKAGVLHVRLGKAQKLTELIAYSQDAVVSKTILDKPAGTITLFAFDRGQKLSEHTVPYDAIVQVLDGRARLTIGGRDAQVSTGQIIIMPADVPHAVTAEERFKMLLTMIRK